MAGWNYGDLFDSCGDVHAENSPALLQGDRVINWGQLTRRSNNLARSLQAAGAIPGDKVAIYMRNCPEYIETMVACFKARLVPVNVNYRYLDDELYYILDNSDAVATVYDPEFFEHIKLLKLRLSNMQWLEVGEAYEQCVTDGSGEPLDIDRSGDDLLFIYTGGTTGMPKAVMWRQEDIWHGLGSGLRAPCNTLVPESPDVHIENLRRFDRQYVQLIASPMMHGTGLLASMSVLSGGGSLVSLTKPGLNVEELWDTVEKRRVNAIAIVGDAFAKPMLKALEKSPGRWDIRSLELMTSSGVMWSPAVKDGLLAHNSKIRLTDSFASSEALGLGMSVTEARSTPRSARFILGRGCKVFKENFEEVTPGSGERGFIAKSGSIPLGYYNEPGKTAETFPVINGVRYAMPGDSCTVDADGAVKLLGRGSACINSGGEKIFPEEVEEALKTHAKVDDALVFGIDDDKWGQAVTAVVLLAEQHSLDESELRAHVHSLLADYKSPKTIYAVTTMFRAPNGKADYNAAKIYVETL